MGAGIDLWIAGLVVIFLLIAGGGTLLLSRRLEREVAPAKLDSEDEDSLPRHVRESQLQAHGTELLTRRIALDGRRGTLGGDDRVYDAFERLLHRRNAAEISEEEFETEKVRLLEGR